MTDAGQKVTFDEVLHLESGEELPGYTVAYQTYGKLNRDKSNAVLICHALTGDQFAAGINPVTGKDGWWNNLFGSGNVFDTDKFFFICSNILGGCMGSSGPTSINPKTGKPYMLSFPVVTIADMVKAQKRLIDYLGIARLFCVVGGSLGGMQTLEWATSYKDMLISAIVISSTYRSSAQNIAFQEVGRNAIIADPDFCRGNYMEEGKTPRAGLAIARQIAHITYLSEKSLQNKFGRNLQDKTKLGYNFNDIDFQVESYLRHQGEKFTKRFDANSYLYITRAADYFDLTKKFGTLGNAFKDNRVKFCIMSFSSDWLFPTKDSQDMVKAIIAADGDVSFAEFVSDKGHDAFLLPNKEYEDTLKGFLLSTAKIKGIIEP